MLAQGKVNQSEAKVYVALGYRQPLPSIELFVPHLPARNRDRNPTAVCKDSLTLLVVEELNYLTLLQPVRSHAHLIRMDLLFLLNNPWNPHPLDVMLTPTNRNSSSD